MIDQAAALEIARARALENGWAFEEPVEIVRRRPWIGTGGRFEIATNTKAFGAKARFVIDAVTGEILDEGYISR